MKLRVNICHIYLFIILLCAFNGVLYPAGGLMAQGLQYLLILLSLYYTLYANNRYRLSPYFKALNLLLLMFTIYGILLIFSGEELMVKITNYVVANTGYLKSIYISLLPIYPFYVFTKKGFLKEDTVKIWFFVFLFLAIRSFYSYQATALSEFGSDVEITNNVGYTFVALLPALLIFYNKPIIQYLGMMICLYFVVISMKRGAIFSGVLCMVWFMVTNLKKISKKRKWIVVLITVAMVIAGIYFFNYMIETSSYFRYRISQSESGESSGRDDLYSIFFNHFIHENDIIKFLFGNGANATLKIGYNYAHNDWLEIAINQGLLGLVAYLVYWICFFVTWMKRKNSPQAFMAIGMLFIIYFFATLFSMSYNSVTRCSAMVLGYYFAISENELVMRSASKQ